VIFLGGSEGGGEDFGGGINNLTDTGFEFKRQPEEDVGFTNTEIGVGLGFIQILFADKPRKGSDK